MENKLTDDDRKLLTEYLGECWQERTELDCKCENGIIRTFPKYQPNRSFTTADDMMDLNDKLVERGEFESFLNWICWKIVGYGYHSDSKPPLLTACGVGQLLNPPRFFQLVADWLRKE